jgi:hypothetical protein
MVSNSTNINKSNNYITEHKKDYSMYCFYPATLKVLLHGQNFPSKFSSEVALANVHG